MKNYDDWKKFFATGKIDDYLNYIACTRESNDMEADQYTQTQKEGGFRAGINYGDGNGTVSHAGW